MVETKKDAAKIPDEEFIKEFPHLAWLRVAKPVASWPRPRVRPRVSEVKPLLELSADLQQARLKLRRKPKAVTRVFRVRRDEETVRGIRQKLRKLESARREARKAEITELQKAQRKRIKEAKSAIRPLPPKNRGFVV